MENGSIKYEYRLNFPKEDKTLVFFYVSRPIKAISGIAVMGKREPLSSWLSEFASSDANLKNRIQSYLEDCRYAVPVLSFQKTNRIPLSKLQSDFENFVVPRMYYFIEDSELLQYLHQNLIAQGDPIINDFSLIKDEDICPDFE